MVESFEIAQGQEEATRENNVPVLENPDLNYKDAVERMIAENEKFKKEIESLGIIDELSENINTKHLPRDIESKI